VVYIHPPSYNRLAHRRPRTKTRTRHGRAAVEMVVVFALITGLATLAPFVAEAGKHMIAALFG